MKRSLKMIWKAMPIEKTAISRYFFYFSYPLIKIQSDKEVHRYFRAENLDYRGSGFDRGHLAAAANHKKSPNVLQETFLLSNICPQHPGLNRKLWKSLENYTRSLAKVKSISIK